MYENGTYFQKLILWRILFLFFIFFKVQKPLYSQILKLERVSDHNSSSYTLGYIMCENGTYFPDLHFSDEFSYYFFLFFKVQKPLYTRTLLFECVSDPKSFYYTLSYAMCANGTSFRKLLILTTMSLLNLSQLPHYWLAACSQFSCVNCKFIGCMQRWRHSSTHHVTP